MDAGKNFGLVWNVENKVKHHYGCGERSGVDAGRESRALACAPSALGTCMGCQERTSGVGMNVEKVHQAQV